MSLLWTLVVGQVVGVPASAIAVRAAHPERPTALHLTLALGLAFPLIGSLAAWWLLGRADHQAAWHDDLPDPPAPPPAREDPRAALARELAIRPLGDQLRAGERAARQAAARALADLGDARAVQVLQAALGDPEPETRLFASIALVRLEAVFAERLTRARRQQKPAVLARTVRTYLTSGLPQGPAAQALWQELEQAGRALAALPAGAVEGWVHTAAARRALGDLPGARAAAEQALALAAVPPAALELCEALWAVGDVEALALAAGRLAELTPPSSPAHQAARFWAAP